MNRTYYTLLDFVDVYAASGALLTEKIHDGLDVGDNYVYNNEYLLKLIAKQLFNEDVLLTARNWMDEKSGKLFCNYIYSNYKYMCIFYIDKEDNETITDDEVKEQMKKFFLKLVSRINNHYDENVKLIDLYESMKTNLLDPIKNQTKFNDTPQTVTTAGVTSYDDTYNTNVSTNYNEAVTKIARLKEIETYIEDYYQRWMMAVCEGVFFYE